MEVRPLLNEVRDQDPETKVCRPEIKKVVVVVAAAAAAIEQNCWDWPGWLPEGDFSL